MVDIQACAQTPPLIQKGLQLEVISEPARFSALGQEWDRLAELAGVEHLFLTSTWLNTWWELFGDGRKLHVITVRSEGELVAAAPLMINTGKMYGIPVRRLESIHNHHTPRFDFLISKHRDEAYRMIWREISAADCDVVLLAQVPKESPTLAEIEGLALADKWLSGKWSPPPSPFIPLGCEFEKFQKTLTGHHRYNLRKRQERLEKIAPISVECITERSRVREAMKDGLRIEAAAWKGNEGTAMNSDPSVSEFYTRLAERAADLGWLQLTFLRLGERRIAFDYVLRAGDALCGVKIGYDPEFHTYSPGNMLLNLILQDGCKRGAAEYDFLGVDDEWKFDWTKETRNHEWLFLFRNKLRPRLAHHVKFGLLPRLKNQKHLGRIKDTVLRFVTRTNV